MELFNCGVYGCSEAKPSLKQLSQHMREKHSFQKQCNITCNVEGCTSLLQTVGSYSYHVSVKHKRKWDEDCICQSKIIRRENIGKPCTSSAMEFDSQGSDVPEVSEQCENVTAETRRSPLEIFSDSLSELQRSVIDLHLQLNDVHILPTSTSDSVMKEVALIIKSFKEQFSNAVASRLEQLKVEDDILNSMLFENTPITQIFEVTDSKSDKRLQELDYIAPVPVNLFPEISQPLEAFNYDEDDNLENFSENSESDQSDNEEDRHSQDGEAVKEKKYAHYVPILKTLKYYLSNEDVCHSIIRGSTCSDGEVLTGYRDGEFMREHELFSKETYSLRLRFYTDEVELCNPIGSSKGKHKLSAVYFTVDNLEEKFASSLSSIHLALLAKWSDVKSFGFAAVLKPLIDDIKILESDGIEVIVDGKKVIFKGTLSVLSADNLSAHFVGGFSGSFSKGRVCRYCMAHSSDLKNMFSEKDCVLRTSSGHLVHVAAVAGNPKLRTVYGVHANCPFVDLRFWDAMKCLPPDIMHDILESVLPLNVGVVLRGLVKTVPAITSQVLNACFRNFKLSVYDSKSRHPGLPKDFLSNKKRSLPGTASEKWNLFHFLPLMIGHLVPEDNKYWKLYLLCSEICELILAPRLPKNLLSLLEILCEEYLRLWVEISERSVTPKLHYLIHYARLMILYGGLRGQWTMRFESFHQIFKRIAKRCLNFINNTKTLSMRFQKKRCLEFGLGRILPSDEIINSAQRAVYIESLTEEKMLKVSDYLGHEVGRLISVKDARIQGIHLIVGAYVVIDVADNGKAPIFLRVDDIFKFGTVWFIYGKLSFYKSWNEHLRAFVLHEDVEDDDDNFVCIGPHDVIHEDAISPYSLRGETYLKLRTEVFPNRN